jgi:tRNA 2-selenouridine synthase
LNRLYQAFINMPIQKITIEEFLQLTKQHILFDVRSPIEYNHAHITGAISLPLFTDEERKVVGTAYKQQSREQAIKIGLDYFGPKMRQTVEIVEKIQAANKHIEKTIVLHCWRGGMRSAAVAWLLDLYGFKVFTIAGGYKAYRNWVFQQFEKQYLFNIIGGYTGSAKTLVVHQLIKQNKPTIDLEGLANHKGSAFGALGENPQPSQEMFENILAQNLFEHRNSPASIWLEDESQRIGNLQIPMLLWKNMRTSPIYFLDIPFKERLQYITENYGQFSNEALINAIIRIQKRLGGLETKNAINFLLEKNTKACFGILLSYYDKWYQKGLENRENLTALLNKIPCISVDSKTNTQKLLQCNVSII